MVGDRAAGVPQARARPVRFRDRRRGDAARRGRPGRRPRRVRPAGSADTRRLLTDRRCDHERLPDHRSLVTTLLIPQPAFEPGGAANGRALAYLAHEYLGNGFGTRLRHLARSRSCGSPARRRWPGMLNLIPRYLPRYGMAPDWAARRAAAGAGVHGDRLRWSPGSSTPDVDAQGGAYATGVLVLITSAAVAVTLAARRAGQRRLTIGFRGDRGWSSSTRPVDNVMERPDGVKIAACFIAAIMIVSLVSRLHRAFELRVTDVTSTRPAGVPARLRPPADPPDRERARRAGPEEYLDKLAQMRDDNDIPDEHDVIFVEVTVTDPSDFEIALNVHGEVRHGRSGCSRWSLDGAQRDGRAAAARPGRDRRAAPTSTSSGPRATRRQHPAVPAVRRRRGRSGDPGGAAPGRAGSPSQASTCTRAECRTKQLRPVLTGGAEVMATLFDLPRDAGNEGREKGARSREKGLGLS